MVGHDGDGSVCLSLLGSEGADFLVWLSDRPLDDDNFMWYRHRIAGWNGSDRAMG